MRWTYWHMLRLTQRDLILFKCQIYPKDFFVEDCIFCYIIIDVKLSFRILICIAHYILLVRFWLTLSCVHAHWNNPESVAPFMIFMILYEWNLVEHHSVYFTVYTYLHKLVAVFSGRLQLLPEFNFKFPASITHRLSPLKYKPRFQLWGQLKEKKAVWGGGRVMQISIDTS